MSSNQLDMEQFRRQLKVGSIQRAYKALLTYMNGLRTHFAHTFADAAVSNLHQGALDGSYFALVPPMLKHHHLKIAILFNYSAFRFEAWLAGRNRNIQRQYWELIKKGRWPAYRVRAPGKGVDSILECDLAAEFDLDQPADLTSTIEAATVAFIEDIERHLAAHHRLEGIGRRMRGRS